MRVKSLLIVLVVMFLLVACSSQTAGDEPAAPTSAGETPTVDVALPSLDTAVPSATPEAANGTEPTEDEEMEAEGSMPSPAPTLSGTEAVTPVEVNLSELTPEPTVISEPVEAPAPGRPGAGRDEIIQAVTADLAKRLNLAPEEITLLSAELVEWPDGGMGCPAPGMAYITVITPGYKIVLAAGGEEYSYHSDMRGNFVLCGPDGVPVP
jgi:hypothetical protein